MLGPLAQMWRPPAASFPTAAARRERVQPAVLSTLDRSSQDQHPHQECLVHCYIYMHEVARRCLTALSAQLRSDPARRRAAINPELCCRQRAQHACSMVTGAAHHEALRVQVLAPPGDPLCPGLLWHPDIHLKGHPPAAPHALFGLRLEPVHIRLPLVLPQPARQTACLLCAHAQLSDSLPANRQLNEACKAGSTLTTQLSQPTRACPSPCWSHPPQYG